MSAVGRTVCPGGRTAYLGNRTMAPGRRTTCVPLACPSQGQSLTQESVMHTDVHQELFSPGIMTWSPFGQPNTKRTLLMLDSQAG